MAIGPTPSWARAESIAVRKSELLGAMFEDGLLGGRIPAAPAAVQLPTTAAVAMTKTPTISALTRRRPPPRHFIVSFPLLVLLIEIRIRRETQEFSIDCASQPFGNRNARVAPRGSQI
jgi:hypothetical protein